MPRHLWSAVHFTANLSNSNGMPTGKQNCLPVGVYVTQYGFNLYVFDKDRQMNNELGALRFMVSSGVKSED